MITGGIGGWGRVLSFGGIVILFLVEAATLQRPQVTSVEIVGTIGVTVVIAAAWIVLIERCPPGTQTWVSAVLAVVLGAGAVALMLISPQGAAIIAAVVALSVAANRLRDRTGAFYAVVLIVAYLVAVAIRSGIAPVQLLS